MNAYILLCFFAMVLMCQADPSNLEMSSYESLHRRLQNPLLNNLMAKNQQQNDHNKANRQGKVNQPMAVDPNEMQNMRRYGYVPGYGGLGGVAGIGGGAGLNAGLSAGIDAGLNAGIGGSIGAGLGGYGYGYGGLGYPVYG